MPLLTEAPYTDWRLTLALHCLSNPKSWTEVTFVTNLDKSQPNHSSSPGMWEWAERMEGVERDVVQSEMEKPLFDIIRELIYQRRDAEQERQRWKASPQPCVFFGLWSDGGWTTHSHGRDWRALEMMSSLWAAIKMLLGFVGRWMCSIKHSLPSLILFPSFLSPLCFFPLILHAFSGCLAAAGN